MQPHTVNPYASVLRCNFRASFRMVDLTASGDAAAAGSGYDASLSQLFQTYDEIERPSGKWATLETGGWPLDGTCDILPEDITNIQTGFWSDVSGADGTFETDPVLMFPFTADHSSYGFTLLFDDKSDWYPASLTVAAYNAAGALIGSKTVTASAVRQVVDLHVENYRSVAITFHSTRLPFQCVRLPKVIFGIIEQYDRDTLKAATVLYQIDPRAAALPAGELVLTVDNSDARYNMRSPNSRYAYLQEGQRIDNADIGLGETDLEYVNMGKQFYYSSAKAKDGSMTAEVTAHDILYRMDGDKYRKGRAGTDTVAKLIADVLADSGTGLAASIPAEIGNRIIGANIPIVSHREAIRLIAEAAGCCPYIDRNNMLRLIVFGVGAPTDTLDGNHMADWPDIGADALINTVNVTVWTYGQKSLDTETVYTGATIVSGTKDVWIEYDPASGQAAVVGGGTLNRAEYYLRAAKLNITASGSVTITVTGYALTSFGTVYTKSNARGGGMVQPYNITQNELITSVGMAETVAAYQLGLPQVDIPWTDMGNPSREPGDTITVSDAYGGRGSAVIIKERFTYDGGLSCETEAVG